MRVPSLDHRVEIALKLMEICTEPTTAEGLCMHPDLNKYDPIDVKNIFRSLRFIGALVDTAPGKRRLQSVLDPNASRILSAALADQADVAQSKLKELTSEAAVLFG